MKSFQHAMVPATLGAKKVSWHLGDIAESFEESIVEYYTLLLHRGWLVLNQP